MTEAAPRPAPEEPDASLMARAATGDRRAFDILAIRHLPRLHRAATRLLGDPAEAEDVAQEAMLRAWTHAAGFDPARAELSAWLHRIAVNLAIDRRRASRRMTALSEDLPDAAAGAAAAVEQRERRGLLARAVARLPDRQRAAVLLSYGEELPGEEAARLLRVSTRALEGLLRRARLALRDTLRAHDI